MLYEDNLRLGQVEYLLQHIYLRSWPRCLGLVLGNGCNIDCPHCYQSKNGDNLLKPPEIGRELRREFIGLYPYLSTLRIQGGEALTYAGFRELIDDVAATVDRPILSISTNGTLIDDEWAERIVRTPFQTVTVSIDGGTPETYARLRRGARLDQVLGNVRRIQRWKEKLGTEMPYLDSFFVIMRSNFRGIPQYLDLLRQHGFQTVSLQTMLTNQENLSREPGLTHDESISDAAEVRELHALLQDVLPRERQRFAMIRVSGLTGLFEAHGLDTAILSEESLGLYPDSDDLPAINLCPNPWTTLFVVENGDVHLCFLAQAIGNLYEAPLISIWNSQQALAKRSMMVAGRYMASGCSKQWCSWREGQRSEPVNAAQTRDMLVEIRQLSGRALAESASTVTPPPKIAAVRRLLASRERRIAELESLFVELSERNDSFHEKGQNYIDDLEARLQSAEREAEHAWADVRRLEQEAHAFSERRLVRAAHKASLAWARLRSRVKS
jgi:MoaA/NifB/PqqE/SkfB family radical SAM enzyme